MGNISQAIYNGVKIAAIVIVCALFMIAINALLALIVTYVVPDVVREVFALISMFLPFDAGTVFGAISTVLSGLLAFKVARKIFDLTTWSINSV